MSCTEMYIVDKDGNVVPHKEFHNSHRGSMMVWRQIANSMGFEGFTFLTGDRMQKVWDMWQDKSAPLSHRIVMASTFDNVMVQRENLPRLIQAIEEYSKTFDPGNLFSQCLSLKELVDDKDVQAVCWTQTSVNCDTWWVASETDDDDMRRHNINRDSGHWFLFDRLENGEE